MKHLEGSWGSGFRPNGTVRKDVGQRYEEEPSYVLDCKLQIGAVSSLFLLFFVKSQKKRGSILRFKRFFRGGRYFIPIEFKFIFRDSRNLQAIL